MLWLLWGYDRTLGTAPVICLSKFGPTHKYHHWRKNHWKNWNLGDKNFSVISEGPRCRVEKNGKVLTKTALILLLRDAAFDWDANFPQIFLFLMMEWVSSHKSGLFSTNRKLSFFQSWNSKIWYIFCMK